ncbi:MAG: DUF4405 domain-containing protein, partial [Eubacteriales bacterium]|nr:DUF4405 domain-containing protein [Eubacteriales bacterium]
MKFFRKTGWKLLLDIIMAILLALMYSKRVLGGLPFHEIGGLALCGLFIIHKLLNFKWIEAVTIGLFSRRTPLRQKLFWVLDLLLLASFTFILVSGILISKVVFPNIGADAKANVKIWHYGISAFALVLTGIHTGLHMGWIRQRMGFLRKFPAALRQTLAVVLSVAVLAFGAYSVTSTAFLNWIANLGVSISSAAPAQVGQAQTTEDGAIDVLTEADSDMGTEQHRGGGNGTGLQDGLGPHGS